MCLPPLVLPQSLPLSFLLQPHGTMLLSACLASGPRTLTHAAHHSLEQQSTNRLHMATKEFRVNSMAFEQYLSIQTCCTQNKDTVCH